VLATHDPDGGIHLTPIWFLFEDDRFYFASSSGSRKVKNVERSSSASVVVDAREPGRERWVSASGPVEILRNGEAQSINARIRRRYLASEALDGPIEAAHRASDDVTLRMTPAAWRSWTAETGESPEQWFLRPTPRLERLRCEATHERPDRDPSTTQAIHGRRKQWCSRSRPCASAARVAERHSIHMASRPEGRPRRDRQSRSPP
jgi:PPOX class probable F420-dependent enzyme